MSLVSAEKIDVRFDGRTVLSGVSLAVEPGEIITIVGPNGSGKSTLLRALVGAAPIARGKVSRRAGLRIGYAPQRLHLDGGLPITVARFVGARGREAMEMTGVADVADRQVADLSGGQLQRALLARALSHQPDILMLDEPTQGLDQPASASFYRLIETLRAETGCAVLMVSHDLHVVMSASDRVICINGHVCCEGAPAVVSTAPEYRALFGLGTGGALALYQHAHDHHHHDHDHHQDHDHGPQYAHDPDHGETGVGAAPEDARV